MLIPKTFHYIWLGSKPMHPLMIQWCLKWTQLHPNWKTHIWHEDKNLPPHCLTDEYDVIECRHPSYLAKCPTYAKRSDVWRYDLLEQLGGVYMDTDVEPIKNIEPLLIDKIAFAGLCDTKYDWHIPEKSHIKVEVGCSIMGTVAHHPWLKELISNVPEQDPIAQLSLAFPYLTQITANHPNVHVFPQMTFYPITWANYSPREHSIMKEKLSNETYAVHRWSSRWFPDGLKPITPH